MVGGTAEVDHPQVADGDGDCALHRRRRHGLEQHDRDVARAVTVVPRAVGEVATQLGSEAVVDGVVDDAPRRVWACSTIG
jgi:hypothetical protein